MASQQIVFWKKFKIVNKKRLLGKLKLDFNEVLVLATPNEIGTKISC
jgi:hypothetical protein